LTATFEAKWGLWLNANLRRKTALARERASELVSLAQNSDDQDLLLEAYHCRWSTAFFGGQVTATLDAAQVGVELYDIARHRHLGHAFGGHDPGVCAHVNCGNAYQLAGEPQKAAQSLSRALALAESLDHPNSLAHALHNGSITLQLSADRNATLDAARRTVEMSERFGLAPWRAGSLVLVGWASAVGSGVTDAAGLIDAEIENAAAVGPVPQYYLGLAAEVLLAAGRPADGLAHLDRAIGGIDEAGIGFYLPELYRLRGACLLALRRDNKDDARLAFATARDIAKRQGAVILERRAEAALSELLPHGSRG
jgi:tetratricopeptide (TPR) repeat protein